MLAHDRGCERELSEELARTLDIGELPDLAALQTLFAPDPARSPTVHVQLASLKELRRAGIGRRADQADGRALIMIVNFSGCLFRSIDYAG
jgi:hypothetical protein